MPAPATYRCLPPELADRLAAYGITVRRPVEGPLQGLHRSPHFGASVEFAEYRAYTPGDPVGLVDWAVYARSDRYVVRRFVEETNLRAFVLVDVSESLAFRGAGPGPKLAYATRLAAAVLYVLLRQGDSGGLVLFRAGERRWLAPTGSFEGLRPMLRALDAARARGGTDVEGALGEAAERLTGRSLVVVISDLLEAPTRVLRGIQRLRHDGHEVTVFQVLDPRELRLPSGTVAELRELETGRRMAVDLDELREAYAREVQRFLEELRQGCHASGADYHLAQTTAGVEQVLARRAVRP